MPNPVFMSGITGTATIGTNELDVTDWDVTATAVILAYVNSKTGLHPVKQSTLIDAVFSIGVDMDVANQPFASPYNVKAGDTLANVKLYCDGPAGSVFWGFTAAEVRSTSMSMQRPGKIGIRLNCEASGTFNAPGGSTF